MATITKPPFPFSFTTFLHVKCAFLSSQWKLRTFARVNTKKQTEKHTNINYSYLSMTLKGPKSVLFSIGCELSTAQLPAVDMLVIITSNMAKLTTKGSQEPVDPGPECRKCYFANQGLGNAFRVWFQSNTMWESQELEIIPKPREIEVLNFIHIHEKSWKGSARKNQWNTINQRNGKRR